MTRSTRRCSHRACDDGSSEASIPLPEPRLEPSLIEVMPLFFILGYYVDMTEADKIIIANIPNYRAGQEPDHKRVGKALDYVLKKRFMGKKVVIRCIDSEDHEGLSLDELTETVAKSGTDKYDTGRLGVGYEKFNRKGIRVDFYGEEVQITDDLDFMSQQIWEMHHSAIGDRGYGVHVDLVLVYDDAQLNMVMNLYDFHPTSDGYVFRNPDDKPAALLGVLKVTSHP